MEKNINLHEKIKIFCVGEVMRNEVTTDVR
jgi:hypothetical protein